MPTLFQMVSSLEGIIEMPSKDAWITGVTMDSRLVAPGSLFVAVVGGARDGHDFILDAIRRGAAAVVGERPFQEIASEALLVPYLRLEDSRQGLAFLSASFHNFPAHRMAVIGITGTDGKTTTANIVYQILLAAGLKVGMISTVNAVIGERALDTGFHVTTPDAPAIQDYLSQMAEAGLTHVILEVTSHGLAQGRVASCEFDLGLVTNITHEHLDYHGSYEGYQAAKGLLFESLSKTPEKPFKPPRGAVLNRDDRSFDYLLTKTDVPVRSYGMRADADVRPEAVEYLTEGLRFTAHGRDLKGVPFQIPVESRLLGKFNLHNCLAAVTLTRAVMGLEQETIQIGVAATTAVPGRMEKISLGQDFTAIVDFAHTPFALRRSLEAARLLTSGRVIAVFGSAGLRDRMKRRMMAKTSLQLADLTILTAEDPRTEPLIEILNEMAVGAKEAGGVEGVNFWRIPDRREAIRFAVGLARPGDLVTACGKGHEQSMCFGEVEYAWDDRKAIRAAIAERLGHQGYEMPYLPN